MSNHLQARPTEYAGVLFRSKSEAIFARCLDLCAQRTPQLVTVWEYEPNTGMDHDDVGGCRIGGFDFHVLTYLKHNSLFRRDYLLEYKPRLWTDAYRDEFLKKDAHYRKTSNLGFGNSICIGLFCYDFFADEPRYGCFESSDNLLTVTPFLMPVLSYAKQAKQYRFDLRG